MKAEENILIVPQSSIPENVHSRILQHYNLKLRFIAAVVNVQIKPAGRLPRSVKVILKHFMFSVFIHNLCFPKAPSVPEPIR